jgi:predicted DCC family thiol-disulfide oxidoreductase YuxK/predicted metal-dependent hydrolase
VSSKSQRISAMVGQFRDGNLDPHYSGYFQLFNRQKFYEAHDVLENLWLPDRHGANGNFYKGLIQLAGAFVHLQKNRLRPSAALFKLAKANLEKYPRIHEQLDVAAVLELIADWLKRLESENFTVNPLTVENAPRLSLLPAQNSGWLFYDGDCSFCINSVRRFDSILKRSRFVPVQFQNSWARARLDLKTDLELTEMVVLTADGQRFGGTDGIAQIARRIWWTWPLFALAQIPGIRFIFRAIYRRVAANRYCMGGMCKVPGKKTL